MLFLLFEVSRLRAFAFCLWWSGATATARRSAAPMSHGAAAALLRHGGEKWARARRRCLPSRLCVVCVVFCLSYALHSPTLNSLQGLHFLFSRPRSAAGPGGLAGLWLAALGAGNFLQRPGSGHLVSSKFVSPITISFIESPFPSAGRLPGA